MGCTSGSGSFRYLDKRNVNTRVWHHGVESAGEFISGLMKGRQRHCWQALQDEPHPACIAVQPSPYPLSPIPAPAGHAMIVSPHNLTGLWMFFGRLPIAHGVEHFRAGGEHQARGPDIGGQILAADRHRETETDGIVEIDEG